MSLTSDDLQEIRNVVRAEIHGALKPIDEKLDVLAGRVEAIENDVKEIYDVLADLQRDQQSTDKFLRLSIEDKILKTYKEIILTAKQAGVTLPRS